MHHLFYDAGILEYYGVTTIISNAQFAGDFITYARICIAGFAFLSAFGIARTLKTTYTDNLMSLRIQFPKVRERYKKQLVICSEVLTKDLQIHTILTKRK